MELQNVFAKYFSDENVIPIDYGPIYPEQRLDIAMQYFKCKH